MGWCGGNSIGSVNSHFRRKSAGDVLALPRAKREIVGDRGGSEHLPVERGPLRSRFRRARPFRCQEVLTGGRAVASHACSRNFIACRLEERP